MNNKLREEIIFLVLFFIVKNQTLIHFLMSYEIGKHSHMCSQSTKIKCRPKDEHILPQCRIDTQHV